MPPKYLAPAIDKAAFNCPHCGALAPQHWAAVLTELVNKGTTPERFSSNPLLKTDGSMFRTMTLTSKIDELSAGKIVAVLASPSQKPQKQLYNIDIAYCDHCAEPSVWIGSNQVHPISGEIAAHDDMPEPARGAFDEASKVLSASPRAAAALARLALQQLCTTLGYTQKTIDKQIAAMVADGLPPEIQKMLDAVRVFGNNAVHPGEIDVRDDKATVEVLLACMNSVCQRLITEKRQIEEIYAKLPQGARDTIAKRDSQA